MALRNDKDPELKIYSISLDEDQDTFIQHLKAQIALITKESLINAINESRSEKLDNHNLSTPQLFAGGLTLGAAMSWWAARDTLRKHFVIEPLKNDLENEKITSQEGLLVFLNSFMGNDSDKYSLKYKVIEKLFNINDAQRHRLGAGVIVKLVKSLLTKSDQEQQLVESPAPRISRSSSSSE